MKYRKLRIAVSVVSGLCCVLVIVLWMRSYSWADGINGQFTANCVIAFGSLPGCIAIQVRQEKDRPSLPSWTLTSMEADRWIDTARRSGPFVPSRMWEAFYAKEGMLAVPSWFAIVAFAGCATMSAISPAHVRFSLRTLLITTTVVALVLGLIIYATRG